MTLVYKGKTRKKPQKTEKCLECSIFDNIACPSSTLMYKSVTPTNCLKGEHERRGVGVRKGGDGCLCQWMACSRASLFSFMGCVSVQRQLFLHGAMVRLTYSDEAYSCLLWTMLNKMEVDFNVLIACSNACNLLATL